MSVIPVDLSVQRPGISKNCTPHRGHLDTRSNSRRAEISPRSFRYSVAQEITTKTGAKTMGFDAKTSNLFVPTSDNGALQVLVLANKP